MVHIEIILYTAYCIAFSVVCFVVLRKLYTKKLGELEQHHRESIKELEKWVKDVRKEMLIEQDKALISAKYKVSKENELYLSRMNEDISKQLKELSNNVKNKRTI